MNKTVLVTGIGGNVGQGILRNIIRCKYRIRIIGTDAKPVSAGNHLCDEVYRVPVASDSGYIPAMKRICTKENVDLIIPSTDIETYYLAQSEQELPQLSTSSVRVALIFYNKLKTWESFHRAGIPFAQTLLPSTYKNNFSKYIVKPKCGVGSKNIYVNIGHPEKFSDEFVIQQLHIGKEITTAFYITKQNTLLGSITFFRSLAYGMTQQCEVTFEYESKLKPMLQAIVKNFTIKGSCNIQSIVDESSGQIIPFEVNGRISGTNSVRSHFGFEDVRYTLDEYLYGKSLRPPHITEGSAIRIMTDIIYPQRKLKAIKNKKDKHYTF